MSNTVINQRSSKTIKSHILQKQISSQTKIHRANLICRILNSYSLSRMQQSLFKISISAKNNSRAYKKMGVAINSIFRKFTFEEKFNAFYKLKRIMIDAGDKQIRQTQKTLRTMEKSAGNLIIILLKSKRKSIIRNCFQKIQQYAIQNYTNKRSAQRKSIRAIQRILLKNKKYAFSQIKTSQIIAERKRKLHILSRMLRNKHIQRIKWGLWKLSCNSLSIKQAYILQDVKKYENKITNHKDPEVETLRQKRQKLEEHIQRIKRQKQDLQAQYKKQTAQIQEQKAQLSDKILAMQNSNKQLQQKIKQTQQQINAPYSLDEIYQTLYNNFLLFLHQNKQKIYNKEKILQSLTIPLIPVDVPIQSIKQENQVMQELLNQYIVMYGPRQLQQPVEMPYEYLIKQNHAMYKMLVTLLPQLDKDREDLKALKDSVVKLNAKVTEIWGQ